jgi:tripartite-type tricarboxylate transporter receptor subunit TctC
MQFRRRAAPLPFLYGGLFMRPVLFVLLSLFAVVPCAAEYPERPLTVISGFPAGGMVDVVARVVADGMKAKFPKGVVVVNKSGAGGAIAMADVVQAKPDGYTIALTPLSTLVIGPQINKLAFRTPDDYEPFINVVSYYPLIVVRADAPWKNIQELVADAKANPGKIRVGTPGEGTSSHLNLEEFMYQAGTQLTHVPYAGWGQSAPALLGGHIDAVVAQPIDAKPQVDGKKMRALVMFQPARHPAFPGTPTASEAGWKVANGVWYLLVATKGTPAPVLKYLHDAAKAALDDPAFAAAMNARGADVDYRGGPALRAELWKEYKLHTPILRRIGMIK